MAQDRDERGVYYRASDYCRVGRRMVVDIIDVVAAFLIWYALNFLLLFDPKFKIGVDTLGLTFFLSWFGYFVLLKRSPFRTPGYKLADVKVVNLRGERPSFLAYCERFLFSFLGPFNFPLDMLWLWSDPFGQTLRDKLTHSYIVRARAEPLGWGPVVYSSYHLMGWSLLFAEVRRPLGNEAR